ncbi:hypothetical protein [Acidovorax sp. SDU_ACID1]|uniref:hypothetical protein n=1 Tax=Acidovorax sp. SDU_ACID1 TaxID=3136632 RepID=UPI00387394EE
MQEMKKTDGWGKLEIAGKIVAAILISPAIAYLGYEVSRLNKQREGEIKFVELAANILAKEPDPDQSKGSKGVRQWSVDVIDRYSGVPMPKEVADAVVNDVALPIKTVEASGANAWAVVFGADKSVKEAQDEIKRANGAGITGGQIFFRAGSYRSVKVYDFRPDAQEGLKKARAIRSDAYLVNMATWCPVSKDNGGYLVCEGR